MTAELMENKANNRVLEERSDQLRQDLLDLQKQVIREIAIIQSPPHNPSHNSFYCLQAAPDNLRRLLYSECLLVRFYLYCPLSLILIYFFVSDGGSEGSAADKKRGSR